MCIWMQKINFISLLFCETVKTLQTFYAANFENAWPSPLKITLSICRKLSWLQKSTLSLLLLKILQRNSKLAILDNLGLSGHPHLKWWYQFEETFDVYLHGKDQLHSLHFPWDIAKILQTCYFVHFEHGWLRTLKVIMWTCRKLLGLSISKKLNSSSRFFWRYCKDMETSYFGVLRACLPTHTQN